MVRRPMSPKNKRSTPINESPRFTPLHEDWPTEFARQVVRRINQLRINRNGLSQRLCEVRGEAWHKGKSGPIALILTGKRPPSVFGEEGVWLKALDIPSRSLAAADLLRAYREACLITKTGGAGSLGESAARRVHELEEENLRLRSRIVELEAELDSRRSR